jgi:hypothetical protein
MSKTPANQPITTADVTAAQRQLSKSKSKTPTPAIDAGIVLMRLSGQREALEQEIRVQVATVLSLGGTWRTIGAALGTTGQAAWERYRPEFVGEQTGR